MSKENLDQFIQKVADSKELQARIGDEMDADSLIALGAEHGFEFTAEDLAVNVELSDEELDGVAGGMHHHQHPLIMDGHKVHKSQVTHLKPQPGDWAEKYDIPFKSDRHSSK